MDHGDLENIRLNIIDYDSASYGDWTDREERMLADLHRLYDALEVELDRDPPRDRD